MFRIPRPVSGTFEQWDEWEAKARHEHPVRYFLTESLPLCWARFWRQWIHEPLYWLKCRIWNRYNVVVCRDLPVTWNDRDDVLLHASFQILKDFVDREKPFDHFDTVESPNAEAWKEVAFLYDWWEVRRDKDNDDVFDSQSHEVYENDNAMLCRLIQVRAHLWT